jgi:hypothetical protein
MLILRDKSAMYEREEAFYLANKPEFREKYHGKHIVIIGEEVVGVYNDAGTAYHETIKNHPLGSFMLQEIPESIEDEAQYLSPFLGVCCASRLKSQKSPARRFFTLQTP